MDIELIRVYLKVLALSMPT